MIKNACTSQKVSLKSLVGGEASSDAIDLLNKLLVFNPIKRLTAEQALSHAYVSKFHDESEEIELNSSVIIPLNDDVRLSVDDYRNKLYEIMSSHHNSRPVKTLNKGVIKLNPESLIKQDVKSKVCKDTERYLKTRYQIKEKPYNTLSEPKLSHTQHRTKTNTANIKSDSKIPKQYITFPADTSYHKVSGDTRKTVQSSSEVQTKQKVYRKRTMNSKSNIYMSFNSYNQNHGVITQTALMELKAAGLR